MSLDLQFLEKAVNDEADLLMTAKLPLPCGHVIEHDCICKDYPVVLKLERNQALEMMRKRLAYWFETRIPWHDCDRVRDGNPNGLIPRDERKSKTGPYSITKAAQTA